MIFPGVGMAPPLVAVNSFVIDVLVSQYLK